MITEYDSALFYNLVIAINGVITYVFSLNWFTVPGKMRETGLTRPVKSTNGSGLIEIVTAVTINLIKKFKGVKIDMNNKQLSLSLVLIFVILISACAGQQTRAKSSVVDYLYPKGSEVVVQPSVPTLKLPLKVGIAFVPDQTTTGQGRNIWTGVRAGGAALTSASKSELLENVAKNFKGLEFVSDIEVIPSEYLTANGGFSNLQQIQTMYGIDVIALVSYDQVQFTDEGFLSLTYWTIVGAYVVSGEKNDTSTMLDTVVYDIKSRKMLFRAPGTSVVKGSATPINLSEELRADSIQGFKLAAESMTENLKVQLEKFKEKIKTNPEQVKIVRSQGYSGGGAISLYGLAIFLILLMARRNLSNKTRS